MRTRLLVPNSGRLHILLSLLLYLRLRKAIFPARNRTVKLAVVALFIGLLATGQPLRAQSAASFRSDTLVGQVLCQALNLTGEQAIAFLPLFHWYEASLQRLRERHPILWEDAPLSHRAYSESEAWLCVESMLVYERSKNRLDRRLSRRLMKILPPPTVAHFFQLERQQNPLVESGNGKIVSLLETP